MREMVKVLEKIGQTQSMNQFESINQFKLFLQTNNLAFDHVIKNTLDQICMQFPEDDEE